MRIKFGEHIRLDSPKPISFEEGFIDASITQITSKAMIKVAEQIDDAIFDEIVAVARCEGIDDVYLLDKKNILSALEKQIPKKPIWDMGWVCPDCKNNEIQHFEKRPDWNDLFCVKCGKALKWGDGE